MAFETGVATSRDDLIAKLVTFATTQLGWTNLGSAPAVTTVSPAGTYLQSPLGGIFGIGGDTNTTNAIHLMSCTSHSPGVAFQSQPNTTFRNYSYGRVGPNMVFPTAAYWFFGTGQYLHFVVEDNPGEFWHGAIGTLDKNFSYSGGHYACGTSDGGSPHDPGQGARNWPFTAYGGQGNGNLQSNGLIIDGTYTFLNNNNNAAVGYSQGAHPACGNQSSHVSRYVYNDFVGRTLLTPLSVFCYSYASVVRRYFIGKAPAMAGCGLKYIGGKGTMTLGSDTWYLFPIRKYWPTNDNQAVGQISTGLWGLAYKRVD